MSSIAINKKINDNRVSLLKVGKKARIVIYAFMAIYTWFFCRCFG